uniref:Transmembrane protein n=1 Tax=Neospora caninum (strain Liverpool) TaxID=572307 RepID=A0A0F7UQK6_NEOCL|nr:TPA: hypothetical protein BN1204_063900 [Neospora caninum Liverpool]
MRLLSCLLSCLLSPFFSLPALALSRRWTGGGGQPHSALDGVERPTPRVSNPFLSVSQLRPAPPREIFTLPPFDARLLEAGNGKAHIFAFPGDAATRARKACGLSSLPSPSSRLETQAPSRRGPAVHVLSHFGAGASSRCTDTGGSRGYVTAGHKGNRRRDREARSRAQGRGATRAGRRKRRNAGCFSAATAFVLCGGFLCLWALESQKATPSSRRPGAAPRRWQSSRRTLLSRSLSSVFSLSSPRGHLSRCSVLPLHRPRSPWPSSRPFSTRSFSARSFSFSSPSSCTQLFARKTPFLSSNLPDDERGVREDSEFFGVSLADDIDALSSAALLRRQQREADTASPPVSEEEEEIFPAVDARRSRTDFLFRASAGAKRGDARSQTAPDAADLAASWGDDAVSLEDEAHRRRQERGRDRGRDSEAEREEKRQRREDEALGRFKVGDTAPELSLTEHYYHNMPLPPPPPEDPDDPLPFPMDFISEEEKQDIRRMPTKEEREADRKDYFGSDNVRAYHLYNPHWTPYEESNYRPSHNLEATAVGDFGQSPRRPMRESDMAQPSVPFGWRVYAAVCLTKLPLLLADYEARVEALLGEEKKHFQEQTIWTQLDRKPEAYGVSRPRLPLPHPPYHVWETSIHPRLQFPFIVWARLSARLCNSSAKMLEMFRLLSLEKEKRENRFSFQRTGQGIAIGDYFIFAAPTLHHAVRFLESNPKHKAGVYREGHLYELTDATAEHVLLGKGERRSAERDEIYLSLGFYLPPPRRAPWPKHKEESEERKTSNDAGLPASSSPSPFSSSSFSSSSSASPSSASPSSASPSSASPSSSSSFLSSSSASPSSASPSSASPSSASPSSASPSSASPSSASPSSASPSSSSASSVRFSPSVSSSSAPGRSPALALLQEKQLRYLCRSNCVERRSFLFFPRPDSVETLLLPPEQLLPMTPEQNARVFQRWKRRTAKARAAAAAAETVVDILKRTLPRLPSSHDDLTRAVCWKALHEALTQPSQSPSSSPSQPFPASTSPSALSAQPPAFPFSSLEDKRAAFFFSVVQRAVEAALNSHPAFANTCETSGADASSSGEGGDFQHPRTSQAADTSPPQRETSRGAAGNTPARPDGVAQGGRSSGEGGDRACTLPPRDDKQPEEAREAAARVDGETEDGAEGRDGFRGPACRRGDRGLEENAQENFELSVSAAATFVLGLVAGDDGKGGSIAVATELAKLGLSQDKGDMEMHTQDECEARPAHAQHKRDLTASQAENRHNRGKTKHGKRDTPTSPSSSSSSSAFVLSALQSVAASAVSARVAEDRLLSASRARHLRELQRSPLWLSNPHSPLAGEKSAAVEALLFFAEDDEEARDFSRRLPYTRGGVYRSLFLAHAVKVDFYGKAREMMMPNPRHTKLDEDELEVDEEAFCPEKVDHADWLIQNKFNVTEDAAHDLDKPFYRDYLKDWVYLHLPEGHYLAEPFHATGQDETGDIPDPPLMTALAANRVEDHARDYRPGVWLYKPETKILYNDTETGALLIGSGYDGTYSWDKPVSNETMTRALILMEMAAEHVRKGHFTWTDDHWSYTSKRPNLETHMSHEEEARMKWGLEDFDLDPDDLDAGMEYLNPELLKSRPPEYQRLVEDPDVAHNIHQDWLRRVDRGEATLNEDPFRLSPEQIDLREKFKSLKELEDDEADLPEVTLWRDEGE